MSTLHFRGVREVTYCGSKLPPVFYSDGPELRIKMTGKVSKQMRGFSERFIARYEATLTHPPHQRNCGK